MHNARLTWFHRMGRFNKGESMKAILLSLILSTQVQAQFDEIPPFLVFKEVIIADETYTVDIQLNPQTVLCLVGDYGANSFKIAVPQIADFTYLDHTSPGAPGPCINAGFCKSKDQPDWGATSDDRFAIFHDLTKPMEVAQIRVVRKEILRREGTVCIRNYVEHLSSTIRGTVFQHVASMPLSEAKPEDCN